MTRLDNNKCETRMSNFGNQELHIKSGSAKRRRHPQLTDKVSSEIRLKNNSYRDLVSVLNGKSPEKTESSN